LGLVVYLLNSLKFNFKFNFVSDLETAISFKISLSSIGLLSHYSNLADYSATYFTSIRVKELECYALFVSLNSYLRTEIPLLNSRVRKSYNHYMSNFKFFATGLGSNYLTYPIKLIANNKLTSLTFLSGKSTFSKFLAIVKNKIVIFYNNSSYYFLPPFFIKNFEPITINIQSSISSITTKHVGLNLSSNLVGPRLYAVGADVNSLQSPLIYQGSHGTHIVTESLLLMPTSLFAEKTSHYLNIEGFLQKAHAAITPDKLVKKDWEIFIALADFNAVVLQSPIVDFVKLVFLKYKSN
jgi:hypothetical protein